MDTAEPARPTPTPEELRADLKLTGLGWFGNEIPLALHGTPFLFLLKEVLRLSPEQMALFNLLKEIPSYFKVPIGLMVDHVPIGGSRRRGYVLGGFWMLGVFFAALAVAPRTFGAVLSLYLPMFLAANVLSTVLGGLMVERGLRHGATGRFSAQRKAVGFSVALVLAPVGGWLAQFPWTLTASICSILAVGAALSLSKTFAEPPINASEPRPSFGDAMKGLGQVMRAGTLWAAAGLICLVVVAPGFGTPLLFYQVDTLHFPKPFLGILGAITAATSLAGALLYARFCRRWPLRLLLAASILVHALATLLYLYYRSQPSALLIAACEGLGQTLAILPLYDLAARATPRGNEAMGYAVMMSVWNLTSRLSDVVGTKLQARFDLTFHELVWLNAGTTLLVLVAVPFLPRSLMDRTDAP